MTFNIKYVSNFVFTFFTFLFFCLPLVANDHKPKNVILMIGDGMGPGQIKALRLKLDSPKTDNVDPLFFDQYLVGTLTTDPIGKVNGEERGQAHSKDVFLVTDSAASATAYSAGAKTFNGALGINDKLERKTTVLEHAKKRGKKTGLVATAQITHATPAAFIAHVESRREYNAIADSFVDNRLNGEPVIDVFLGGGMSYFKREDRDLISELEQLDFTIVTDKKQLNQASGKIAGLFGDIAIAPVMERTDNDPSLAELTTSAIQQLNNEKGFFLMVEGSQIDWFSHDNNIAGTVSEMEDFADAIKVAIDFAKKDGETIVLITADHETGGLSIGARYEGENYYEFNMGPIRRLKQSLNAHTKIVHKDKSLSTFLNETGIELNKKEEKEFKKIKEDGFEEKKISRFLSDVINRATRTGWTTRGHTGVDVYLYGFGPGSEAFRGVNDNTKIGQTLHQWLELH
ncbi:MAG: alkaline phosphatase [Gammaproteobacteria bacterium]|nr:alkaline phosphatase [Gammaproteobacteria bacterium]